MIVRTRADAAVVVRHVKRSNWIAVGISMVLAFTTLGLAIWDEPLHIDELRQVGYYPLGIPGIIEGAFSQNQPPLDYLVGAVVELLFSPGRLAWRLPGFTFALLTLLCLSALLRNSLARSWFVIGLVGLTPVYLQYSSYARPYALPLFLMVALLLCFDRWRAARHGAYLIVASGVAIALPLSRTTEPLIFLVVTVLSLLVCRWVAGRTEGAWIWWPTLISCISIGVVAAVISFVDTSGLRSSSINSVGLILRRLWPEIVRAHSDMAPLGTVGLLLSIGGLVLAGWRIVRGEDLASWWLAPLALIGFLAPLAFAALSGAGQPYFDRYTYFAVPGLAVGVAYFLAVVPKETVSSAVSVLLLFPVSWIAVRALSEVHRPDFQAAAEVSSEFLRQGDAVIFEYNKSIAGWRPGSFPVDTFVQGGERVMTSDELAWGRTQVGDGVRPLLMIEELNDEIDGWTAIPIAPHMSLAFPNKPPAQWNREEQAAAIQKACMSLPADVGSNLCVVAARLLVEGGDIPRARVLAAATMTRIDDDRVRAAVAGYLNDAIPAS